MNSLSRTAAAIFVWLIASSFAHDAFSSNVPPVRQTVPPPTKAGLLKSVTIQPGEIFLTHISDRPLFIVMVSYADDSTDDVTLRAKCEIVPNIAIIEAGGLIRPVQNGTARLNAQFGGRTASILIRVQMSGFSPPWDFATQIAPIFTKYGCNGANCHGSPVGKPQTENNLKLSLFGGDPDFDYDKLSKDFKTDKPRIRWNASSPDESLLLKKPTAQVPHGGGQRFPRNSATYRLVRRWIADGAPKGPQLAPELAYLQSAVSDIEVLPNERVFRKIGQKQRLIVLARFANGQIRDVTPQAKFVVADDGIATVDDTGTVTSAKDGETVVIVRYLSYVKAPRMMIVTRQPLPDDRIYARNNFIDDVINKKLRKIRVLPSDLTTDEEFVRRLYVDVIGQMPNVDEVRAFLADMNPAKRSRLIETLLDRAEYVDFWTVRWGDLLRNDRRYLTPKGMWEWYEWIRNAVERNMPWDEFVRSIIIAKGSTYKNGPANFYRVNRSSEERTSAMSQAFLGIRIECARCHNHPFDRWTNDDYHGLAAFFARVALKNGELTDNTGQLAEQFVVVNRSGDHTRDVANRPRETVSPKLLDGALLPREGEADRRMVLAEWMTSRTNRQFSRAIVNRLWGHFMGRGIVEPVDDFRVSNPPVNEELLDALSDDMVNHGFDIKHVIHTICNSRTYQLTWRPNATNEQENLNFSRHYVRRLSAEQLLDGVNQVTGVPEKFGELPLGTKAIQLPDTANMGYFLDIFGKPKRTLVCECERDSFGNMSQALHLINSPQIQGKIQSPQGRISRLIRQNKSDSDIVEELYIAAFQRKPRQAEMSQALSTIRESINRQEGIEDVLWALINSREFIFNH